MSRLSIKAKTKTSPNAQIQIKRTDSRGNIPLIEKITMDNFVLNILIDNLPHAIFWKDNAFVFQGCNMKFAQQFGYNNPYDIIGKTDSDFPFSPELIQKYQEDDKKILESGIPQLNYEELQRQPDGTDKTVLVSKVPFYDKNHNIIGILGIYSDITELKETREQLIKAKEAAEAASNAKTEFLENMRHDIRTPLTGIVGFSDIIKQEATNQNIKEYADNLVASSYALLDFMDDILESIRVSSGEIPRVKKKFSLKKTLRHVIDLNVAKAQSKKLQLSFECDQTIPKYLLGDNNRIHRIVLELVANALNFTDNGFVKLCAKLAKKDKQQAIIELIIEDSGMGIPKDRQQEIFIQFKKLKPSYEGIYKGAGLGLSVIKQFIDEVGGEIYVESEINKGSKFTCIIPLQVPLLENETGVDHTFDPQSSIKNPDTASKPLSKTVHRTTNFPHTALIVEDNEIAANVVKALLKQHYCTGHIAHDGQTAIQLFKKNHYDIVIMDIGLPDLNGYEVTHHIRLLELSKKQYTPIVALTAHAGEENKQRCIEAGMSAVITKPLSSKHCKELLDSFIPSRKKVQEQENCQFDLPEQESALFDLDQYPLLDVEEGVKSSGSQKMLNNMLKALTDESLLKDLAVMKTAYEVKDWEQIQKIAHKIKGGAVYVGVIRMKMACQYLERYWKSGQSKHLDKLYHQAVHVINTTIDDVKRWLKQKS